MFSRRRRKYCFVPNCCNTSENCPDKVFVNVPQYRPLRSKWFQAIGLPASNIIEKSCIYCCQDHFDLPNHKWVRFIGRSYLLPKQVLPTLKISKRSLPAPLIKKEVETTEVEFTLPEMINSPTLEKVNNVEIENFRIIEINSILDQSSADNLFKIEESSNRINCEIENPLEDFQNVELKQELPTIENLNNEEVKIKIETDFDDNICEDTSELLKDVKHEIISEEIIIKEEKSIEYELQDMFSDTEQELSPEKDDLIIPKISTEPEYKLRRKAAQYNREYRARKKALKNSDHTQILKKRPKTSAERTRECRARKKALQNAANLEFSKPKAKTSTERSREFRARQIASENGQIINKKPKTPAERTRECRARKKALKNAANRHFLTSNQADSSSTENCNKNVQKLKKKPKTSAERTRECRARKKALKYAANGHFITSNIEQSSPTENCNKNGRISTKKVKTSAERTRECRARKKAMKNAVKNLQTIDLLDDMCVANDTADNSCTILKRILLARF